MDTSTNARLATIEKQLEDLQRYKASKLDLEEMKNALLWRILIGAAVLQGIIAAVGAIYILDQIGPTLIEQIMEAIMEAFFD
ncbi:MAG: hypothetical protein F4Z82_14085 [Caldilineaceae bacterium SB0668_bin_21]|nr:hypothetical protein [Caldilineaceae bacterium SB0668_bin_21]MYC23894.1 hypothetical protein [Caldilineaceae bacterium SB0662_bin_25]